MRLCLEDYNKGLLPPAVCRRVIELAREAGVPVLVDPAAIKDYSKYAGATAITPNRDGDGAGDGDEGDE